MKQDGRGGRREAKHRGLGKEIAKRDRWIDQRDRRIDKLEQENDRLRPEIEKLQQTTERLAAPFSKGTEAQSEAARTKGRPAVWPTSASSRTAADRSGCGSAGAVVLPGLSEDDEAGSSRNTVADRHSARRAVSTRRWSRQPPRPDAFVNSARSHPENAAPTPRQLRDSELP